MMTRALIFSCVLSFITFVTKADYVGYRSTQLMQLAELVVKAKISAISEGTIICKIEKVYKGEVSSNKIEIKKFKNWTCARRYEKYAINQEAIFFLSKNKKDNLFQILSLGNEGEMPIINKIVYFKSRQYGLSKEINESIKRKDTIHYQGRAFLFTQVDSVLSNYREVDSFLENKITDSTIWKYRTNNSFIKKVVEEKVFYLKDKPDYFDMLQWQSDFYNLGFIIGEPKFENE